jgi:hypothetical protein
MEAVPGPCLSCRGSCTPSSRDGCVHASALRRAGAAPPSTCARGAPCIGQLRAGPNAPQKRSSGRAVAAWTGDEPGHACARHSAEHDMLVHPGGRPRGRSTSTPGGGAPEGCRQHRCWLPASWPSPEVAEFAIDDNRVRPDAAAVAPVGILGEGNTVDVRVPTGIGGANGVSAKGVAKIVEAVSTQPRPVKRLPIARGQVLRADVPTELAAEDEIAWRCETIALAQARESLCNLSHHRDRPFSAALRRPLAAVHEV